MSDSRSDDELLARYLDGVADEAELAVFEQRLVARPELADALAAVARFEMLLQTQLGSSKTDQETQPPIGLPVQSTSSPAVAPARVFGPLGSALHGTVGYFSTGWPVAYLVATAIFGIGLVVGSLVHVSDPVRVATQLPPAVSNRPPAEPPAQVVGQITGMVDCRWERSSRFPDPKTQDPRPKTVVSLGDKFALASGLMEITYHTGAKVILQGPVSYETESNGGYLSVGKLTGKLETKVQDPSPKTPDPSSFILHPSSFVIRTPTATVTDLGTEFGVEVSKEGQTLSHVFRGSVELRALSGGGQSKASAQVLHAHQSARVEAGSAGADGGLRIVVAQLPTEAAGFVRAIATPAMKTLDLADVVAGGDGFSGRRSRGIDPHSGRVAQTAGVDNRTLVDDGKYHRVAGMPFVDGVFVPCGRNGPVQLDSAGHTFAWFPSVAPYTFGTVWAGKDAVSTAELGGVDYDSPGHAMIDLHANKAVTFDLEAIRRANPGWKLLRFCAVAGNTALEHPKASVFADLWLFVDGQVRFQRREINRFNGAMPAVIPLGDRDRFLTLAATDGGDDIGWDHTIFGDPRLEMAPVKATAGSTPPREATEH